MKGIMGIFGDYDVRLDPWDVEYGPEVPLQLDDVDEDVEVVLDAEVPPDAWVPISPSDAPTFHHVHFVDGVRRIEARLLVRRGELLCHGAFGSAAVGATHILSGRASCSEPIIERVVALGSGALLPLPIPVRTALEYAPASWPEPNVDGPLRAVQKRMRDVEEAVARTLAEDGDSLVVADGPLSYEHPVKGNVLGYIKRVFQLYLPARLIGMVAGLPVAARTPLFVISKMKRARFSWFQRIGVTRAGDSELSGIVRMEVSSHVGVDVAARLANAAATQLPRFVPPRGRDPRAPQNLLPIGALEGHLRRCLGDARLVRRWIQTVIASEAQSV